MNTAQAVELAQDALIWLAERPEPLAAFLAASGSDVADLRRRAADPEFLGFLLDFILSNDAHVRDFAACCGCPPEDPMRARAALPGGMAPDWT